MPSLRVLSLISNPVTKLKNYRKMFINECVSITSIGTDGHILLVWDRSAGVLLAKGCGERNNFEKENNVFFFALNKGECD